MIDDLENKESMLARDPWRELFTIHSYHVGPSGFVTAQSLCHFLQESAANHAELLKVGGVDLAALDQMWVLSRLRLRMHKSPYWRDKIKVVTWPSARTKGVRAHRDFQMFDASSGELLGEASSIWLLLDRRNRRPVRLPQSIEPFRLPGLMADLLVEDQVPPLSDSAGSPNEKRFEVCSTHIDFNNHVNNVCYLTWALDTLPGELFRTHVVSELLLNFLSEAKVGELVVARTEQCTVDTGFKYRHRVESATEGSRGLAAIETCWISIKN
jgi:acyl-ACP thioesterase